MTTPKTALITGVTGQDGAYLAEFLLKKGYVVHGIKRRASSFNTSRIDHLYQDPHVEARNFILHYGDMTDSSNLIRSEQHVQPDEIYNDESPLRGETFVTRKITRALARIALGLQDCLHLGNLSALRDWGHARDYIEMQWLMLQQQEAEDFVIATGVQVSVREFVQRAAAELGITVAFSGEGEQEVGTVAAISGDKAMCKVGDVVVRVDPRYFRPTEVETLLGDPGKAKRKLGWYKRRRWANLCAKWSRATMWPPSATAWSSRRATRPSTFTNDLRWVGTGDWPRLERRIICARRSPRPP